MSPLRSLSSLKLKLGIVIVAAVWVTAVSTIVAVRWLDLPPIVGAAGGIVLALACVQVLARGTTRPLREMAAVATAMAGGEHGRHVTVTSSDEVGELARAFNSMTAELAETDRLRRDLVANVSHELRTPIGALQAVLENVVDGVSEPDPETLRTMLAQTRRLGRLVTQLLDLSRLEAGDQPFDIRAFAVADVLRGAAREARLHAPEDVVFSIDDEDGVRADGDPERIHQVVTNLVENAVRYSPRPGHVALRASRDDRMVRVEVDDDGPGIPHDELERVFERFYRGDGRRGADGGGAGLGLAIARWIVQLHGGTIHAERREPHGNRMVVTLPRGAELVSVPARSALAATVAGALAALLLPGVPAGIGYVIVAGALAVAAGLAIGPGQRPRSAVLGALAVALALSAALRDASWVVAGELAAAIVLGSIAMSVPRGWRATGLAAIAAPRRSPSGALGMVRAALDGAPSASGARALAVGRGLLLAAALVVVFGALFATGDRAFAQVADDALPGRLPLDDLALRVLLFAFVVALAGGMVRAAAVDDAPARPALLRIGPVEWRLALIALNLLFALFVAVQVAVLFGGDGYVRDTAGLTYAEYARSGFAQLVLVALLTLAVVAASLRWACADGRRAERLLRVLLVALCLLTLVVLASALHRLGLYERAFGFTRTRLAVHALLLFGGALFILVVIGLAAGRRTWLPRATVALAAAAALAFWVSDPDRRIAAHNVERYEATGRIDVDYLDQLSADAVPELARLPADLRNRALRSQRLRLQSTGDGFGGANRSRARARQVIAAVP